MEFSGLRRGARASGGETMSTARDFDVLVRRKAVVYKGLDL